MGGRGSSAANIPEGIPGPGVPGNNGALDANPGVPETLSEALGTQGRAKSLANAVAGANPFYSPGYGEYTENCQRCIVSTEARIRGYDVQALPTYDGDTLPMGDNWKRSFVNPQTQYISRTTPNAAQRDVEQAMRSYGNGSRAVLQVEWKGRRRSGHVLNVAQRQGRTYYIDGQTNAQYSGADLFSAVRPGSIELVRTDNLQFSDDARLAVRQTIR